VAILYARCDQQVVEAFLKYPNATCKACVGGPDEVLSARSVTISRSAPSEAMRPSAKRFFGAGQDQIERDRTLGVNRRRRLAGAATSARWNLALQRGARVECSLNDRGVLLIVRCYAIVQRKHGKGSVSQAFDPRLACGR
jgi:hypothetical protein